jgi:hypothetical protein
MNCRKCNTEIADNAKFCPECGSKVGDTLPAFPSRETNSKNIVSQEQEFKSLRICEKGGILKFLVQPDKLKQGGTNEIRENYVRRKGRDFPFAL